MPLLTRRSLLRYGLSLAAVAAAAPRRVTGAETGEGTPAAPAGHPAALPAGAAAAPANAKIPFDMPGYAEPTFLDRTVSIADHGAVAGGEAPNTKAIAAAIEACAKAGGGRVLVPAGVWLTGPIHLKSHVNLHVAEGAELRFSKAFADYLPPVYQQRGGVRCFNYSPFIYARGCTDIAVTGGGTLNGQGEAWWPWKNKQPGMERLFEMGAKGVPVEQRVFGTEADGVRPPFIQPIDCRNVLIEGVTVVGGPSWNIHPVTCENVTVRRVSVRSHGPNNDGIDPDGCRNVVIEDCLLDTGDDCICLKAGRNQDAWAVAKPCENVVVRRCRTKRGHGGVVIGSEMSAGVRNVFVHDCRFEGTAKGVRIKSLPGRGGVVENVWMQDLAMEGVSEGIFITLRYTPEKTEPVMPRFRAMHFRRVTGEKAKAAVQILGLKDCYIENITLEDVTISGGSGLTAEFARGLNLTRVNLTPKNPPVMKFLDCQDVTVDRSAVPAGAKVFLQADGAATKGIRLTGIDLSKAEQGVVLGAGVAAGAVTATP